MANEIRVVDADLIAALKEVRERGDLSFSNRFKASDVPGITQYLLNSGYIKNGGNGKRYFLASESANSRGDEDVTDATREAQSTETLRTTLLNTIDKLEKDQIDIKRANAIAALAGKVLDSAKLELAASVASKRLGIDTGKPLALSQGK